MTGAASAASAAVKPAAADSSPTVRACLSILLTSAPREIATSTADSPATAAISAAQADTKSAAPKAKSVGIAPAISATAAQLAGSTADAAASLPQQPHVLQVNISGLEGLQHEVAAVTGATQQLNSTQCYDLYSVTLPSMQLSVTEQLVRSWAAAAAQLQIHTTVLPAAPSEPPGAKKPAAPAAGKGTAAAPVASPTTSIAAGSLQLSCAGLLIGDTATSYCWGNLPEQALQAVAETAAAATAAAAGIGGEAQPIAVAPAAQLAVPAAAGPHASLGECPGQHKRYKAIMQPPDGNLRDWLGAAHIKLQLFKVPGAEQTAMQLDPKAGAARRQSMSGSGAQPAAKPPNSKQAQATATVEDAATALVTEPPLPPEPCSLLSPAMRADLNPIAIYAYKASNLPDAPATRHQLDTMCERVKLKVVWPTLVPGTEQSAAVISPWNELSSSSGIAAVRSATFTAPIVVLGSDLGEQQLLHLCRNTPIQFQLHDRAALPEPPPFSAAALQRQQTTAASSTSTGSAPDKQAAPKAGAAAKPAPSLAPQQSATVAADSSNGLASAGGGAAAPAAADAGQVFGVVSLSLLDLARGGTGSCFALPLKPASTIRGVSCLEWRSRPGRYMEAGSMLKGWIRCAVPIHQMNAASTAETAALPTANDPAASHDASHHSTAAASGAVSAVSAVSSSASNTGAQPVSIKPPAAAQRSGSVVKQVPAPAAAAAAVASAAPSKGQQHASTEVPAESQQHEQGTVVSEQQLQQERLPVPVAHVALPPELRYQGVMTRAVFLMDYRDSDLLHVLEDTVRQHNAIALALAPPPPPSPEEVAAAKAAEEAAATAAAAEAAATAAAAEAEAAAAAAAAEAAASKTSRLGSAKGKAAAAGKASAGAAGAVNTASVAAAAGKPNPAVTAAVKSSAGPSAAPSTPRSILKQSQAGAAATGAAVAAVPASSAADSPSVAGGMAPSTVQQGRPTQRAAFADSVGGKGKVPGRGDVRDGEDDSSGDESSEEEVSEADMRLQEVLRQYEHVTLDARMLQVLSTYQLTADQGSDASLDVITGFHLVDGSLRAFVVEGPAAGKGMGHLIPAITRWALEDQEDQDQELLQEHDSIDQQEPTQQWLPRRVMQNPSIKHPVRLYAALGVDLWMLKLRASLAALSAQASTYTGHVRPECLAGLGCLAGMVQGYIKPQGNTSSSSNSDSTSSKPHEDSHRGREKCSSTAVKGGSGSNGSLTASSTAAASNPRAPSSSVVFMRQLDHFRLFPAAEQLHLVDKKFGGELTKADVLGVEAEEPYSEDDDDDEDEPHSAPPAASGAASMLKGSSSTGLGQHKQQPQQQKELTGSHAAAAAAKAASARLKALLADEQGGAGGEGQGSGPPAAAARSAAARSRRSSRRSGKTSSKSKSRRRNRRGGGGSRGSKKRRSYAPKHPLDMDNSVYLHLRMEAHRRRVQRDLHAEQLQALSELSASQQPLREAWDTWNPQRAATKELQRQIEAGALTLQDTVKARHEAAMSESTAAPVYVSPEEAKTLGWYPHTEPFLWPAPRDPATYNHHPLKPTDYRVEELQEAWQEGEVAAAAAGQTCSRGGAAADSSRPNFDTICHPTANGLFTQDPTYWQTVHLGGDGWEQQQAEELAAAKADWATKVVVKDVVFHGLPGTGDKASAQADRLNNLLKGHPLKPGFKSSHVPPLPVSMFTDMPWEPQKAAAAGSLGAALDRSKWVAETDFNALGNKQRSAVAKPGFSDASTAALHDRPVS